MSDLGSYLAARTNSPLAKVILSLAGAASAIAAEIRMPATALDAVAGAVNADGDTQKKLDVIADEIVLDALRGTAAAAYLSEEREEAIPLDPDGGLIIACDPLDGSSNIGVNVSVGTIFSVLPADGGDLQPGRAQLAAGFFVYGPQTTLLLTTGSGTASFRMDDDGRFVMISENVRIPSEASEFAINASNRRHWPAPITRYVEGCLAGADGPRGHDYNMRWVASLVAETWRIISRGGVFLYPADARKGYAAGRLRLVYEAAPVAMLVEQAGGRATDGARDIMDITPDGLHQRVPLVFGAKNEVEAVAVEFAAG
jgi:fructose-1,6-bisphosphatase I